MTGWRFAYERSLFTIYYITHSTSRGSDKENCRPVLVSGDNSSYKRVECGGGGGSGGGGNGDGGGSLSVCMGEKGIETGEEALIKVGVQFLKEPVASSPSSVLDMLCLAS